MPTTDTFPVLASVEDQWVRRSAASYPISGAASVGRSSIAADLWVARELSGSYFVYNALLKFDTSGLPDATTVNSATLRVWVNSVSNANSLSLVAGWYAWDGTSDSDHSLTPETGAHAGTSLGSFVAGSLNDVALVNAPANVLKTGFTFLRLHVTQRASDAAPTGVNRLVLASFDGGVAPQLLVTHTLPGTPSTLMVGGVGI